MYNLIACVTNKGLLGQENDLYVNSSKDLHYFSQVTRGYSLYKQNIVIMGYNTWLSLPSKPLKNRYNIIVTKNHSVPLIDGILTINSLDEVFTLLEDIKDRFGDVFIIGGASIYKQCIESYSDKLNKLYITELDDEWSGNSNSKYFYYDSVLSEMSIIKDKTELCDIRIYNPGTTRYEIKHKPLRFVVYQKNNLINNGEIMYLQLLEHIMNNGYDVNGRNGLVKSSFGEKVIFNLESFPLLTTKHMGYKTIVRELLWFLKGSTDNQELKDKKVNIWTANASKEFLESRGLPYEEGDLGPVYGFQWRHFGTDYTDCKTNYQGKGVDQIQWLINEIKENPSSRRLILSAWNVKDLDKMALPPCHILSQFYVNKHDNTLSCQLYQRSGDMFLGVPFNIASYAFLTCILAKLTGYIPGNLHHVIGDAHIYEEHYLAVKEQYKRVPKPFPQLIISDDLTDINNIDEKMFILKNYDSYSPIKAIMKV